MERLKYFNNERGLTLLEVLLAIVILTIILVSIMNIFPQMGKINKQNEQKLVTVNVMKEVVHKWKNNETVRNFLKNNESELTENLLENQTANYEHNNYYQFTGIDKITNYEVEVRIAKKSDLEGENMAHRIHVIFYDKDLDGNKGSKITETYGYILYKKEAEETEPGGNN